MSIDKETPVEIQIEEILEKIKTNAKRVKELGEWPGYISEESLAERVPKQGNENAPGFDAGIACALDLIARDRQHLAAALHGAYTPEAVQQVRDEMKDLDPDSETCWWLAACSVCEEGEVNQGKFLQQVEDFQTLIADPQLRLEKAKQEFAKMLSHFYFDKDIGDNVPYGTEDGCMQGAYIAGYPFATQYNEKFGLYFIGTYEDSLGLEDFQWSGELDEQGRPKSGPVWGSKQFNKCANREELLRALEIVQEKFKDKMPKKEMDNYQVSEKTIYTEKDPAEDFAQAGDYMREELEKLHFSPAEIERHVVKAGQEHAALFFTGDGEKETALEHAKKYIRALLSAR